MLFAATSGIFASIGCLSEKQVFSTLLIPRLNHGTPMNGGGGIEPLSDISVASPIPQSGKPNNGLEPLTYCLQNSCSIETTGLAFKQKCPH